MEFKDFIDLARVRQSCRSYDPDREVEVEKLEACLESMKLAPSACNAQPYFYYLVHGDEAKNIRDHLQLGTMNSFAKDVNAKSIDIGISAAYFTAEATTLGLSTCIMGWFDEDKLKKYLGTRSRIRLVIAIGYAKDDKLREKKRKTSDALYKIISKD